MSILGALKQQGSSIDELAKLPQAMIMQMAQRKEIGPEMVAPILARKAQMHEAVARSKALQTAPGQQTSVMDQIMQQNAAAEQPQVAEEAGVAQLEVPERQYAGGGIVAFANNKDQPVDADMPREGESESDYLKRSRAVAEGGAELFNPRNYNPINKLGDLYNLYQEKVGTPFAETVKRFTDESPESQAARFNAASNARKNVSLTDTAPNTRTINSTPSQAEIDKIRATNTAPVEPGVKSLVQKPAAEPRAQSPLQKATGAPDMAKQEATISPLDAMLAKYEKLLAGDPEAAAKAKKEAMWGRLAEAGLNIMGGTSSNFAQNIALASPAVKGYGEDVKGIRAEEAAKMQQLMGLGLKGEALKQEAKKLGITEKHFDQMFKAQMAQIGEMGASRREATQGRIDTALENRIANYAGKLLATGGKYMENPNLAYADATAAITGGGGAAPIPTYNPQTRTFK